ncbi:hypothetical protein REPUB_Repub04eG0199100 [Reevesia pubescens]
MELLSLDDFKHTKFDHPNPTPFHYLLEVARVAQTKIRYGEEKKKHAFYLKYFLYNSPPEPQTLFNMEEYMGFKQGKINVGLKRKLNLKEEDEEDDDDVADEEWEGEGKGKALKPKFKRCKKEKPVCFPIPPPDLPHNVKQHVLEKKGGSDLVLVIQKKIFLSDVNPTASRFSMPFSQLKTHDFLNTTEAKALEDKRNAVQVCLLEPSMKETEVTFKRWYYSGKNSSYVLTSTWNSVVENNQLKIGDIVQLWSFRVESKLCFALVKVPSPTRNY